MHSYAQARPPSPEPGKPAERPHRHPQEGEAKEGPQEGEAALRKAGREEAPPHPRPLTSFRFRGAPGLRRNEGQALDPRPGRHRPSRPSPGVSPATCPRAARAGRVCVPEAEARRAGPGSQPARSPHPGGADSCAQGPCQPPVAWRVPQAPQGWGEIRHCANPSGPRAVDGALDWPRPRPAALRCSVRMGSGAAAAPALLRLPSPDARPALLAAGKEPRMATMAALILRVWTWCP